MADANRPAIAATLTVDSDDVGAAGVQQAPTFFVNGEALPPFGRDQPLDLVRTEIDALYGLRVIRSGWSGSATSGSLLGRG